MSLNVKFRNPVNNWANGHLDTVSNPHTYKGTPVTDYLEFGNAIAWRVYLTHAGSSGIVLFLGQKDPSGFVVSGLADGTPIVRVIAESTDGWAADVVTDEKTHAAGHGKS